VKIIVVIRGRNCKKYLGKCLRSLIAQTYGKWEAFVVLDDPTDGSERVLEKYMNMDSRIHKHINPDRLGLGRNMYFAITEAARQLKPQDKDVFAILDGDDWLSKTAFIRPVRIFEKYPKILITHGSYVKVSKGRKTRISKAYPKSGKVRKLPWRGSHLKCIKWEVLKHIKKEWFQNKGVWLNAASDVALMFPCIELAGLKRVIHIPQATYYWRDNTKKSTKRIAQKKCEKILRKKKPLKRIKI